MAVSNEFSSGGMMAKLAAMRAEDPFSSGFPARISQRFFNMTGLQGYTDITGWVSAHLGSERILTLAKMAKADNPEGQTKAKRDLEKLGIDTDEKLESLLKYSEQLEKMDTDSMLMNLAKDESEAANLFLEAIRVNDSMWRVDPTIADKARFAEHPAGALFSGLQSYLFGYTRNIAMRVVRDMAKGIRGTDMYRGQQVKLSPGERATLALKIPAMASLGMGAANLGVTMLRETLFADPDRKRRDKKRSAEDIWLGRLAASASRANFMGPYDVLFNAFTSAKYQRDPATMMVGPVWGAASELFSQSVGMFGERNSPNTNTAERKLSRMMFNIGVKPVQSAALTTIPYARPAGALNYAIGHPATRDGFVELTAGKPTALKRGQGGKKGPTQY